MQPNFSFWEQKMIFLGSTPHTLDAYGALPLLTEILNTPLAKTS